MNKETEDIKIIREMMEKSSKFLSLNGLSIVFAGVFAIAGALFAYFYLFDKMGMPDSISSTDLIILLIDALIVLALSVGVITLFCWRKAKKNHQSLLNKTTIRAAYNLMIPLLTGGVFSLILLSRSDIGLTASATLIFYGLGLVNASKYTFKEIHYLGIFEIILGLLSAVFPYNGLWFWTLGFGVLHIIFGIIMYLKYDAKKVNS